MSKIEASWELNAPSPQTAWLRVLLTPLAWLHQCGLWCYLLPFVVGIRQKHVLPACVISIGNLASGGTGKTPTTVWLVRALKDNGLRVVVLSRGYGRITADVDPVLLISDLRAIRVENPAFTGDEPLQLAKALPGTPVIVAKNRRDSGDMAMAQFQPDVIVLDDGMQYWQLHRDIEICLLDAARPFANQRILPRGPLREPISHINRADIVIMTRDNQVDPAQLETNMQDIKMRNAEAWVTSSCHAPINWISLSGNVGALEDMQGLSVVAVTAIADARQFYASVTQLNVIITQEIQFQDHHAYTSLDVDTILSHCTGRLVHAVVTTEKDLVKLAPIWPKSAPPLAALRIETRPRDHDALIEAIIDRIVRRNRGETDV